MHKDPVCANHPKMQLNVHCVPGPVPRPLSQETGVSKLEVPWVDIVAFYTLNSDVLLTQRVAGCRAERVWKKGDIRYDFLYSQNRIWMSADRDIVFWVEGAW